MNSFVKFDKQILNEIASENLSMGDGTEDTNNIIMEIEGVKTLVEGYYYYHGTLVLTDKPVRPRNA